jgi:hypothetical protein
VGSRSKARARAQASQPASSQAPQPASGQAPQPASGQAPRTVRWAAIIQACEALGILIASVIAGIDAITGQSYQRASGIAITLIGFGTAVLLVLVARGLRDCRRWSRTPAMLTQLFAGIVAIYLLQAGRLDWGIPALLLAVAGLAALWAPASIDVLTPGRVSKPR